MKPKRKNKFYVYALVSPINNQIFHIGKGHNGRMYYHVAQVKKDKIPHNNKHLYYKIKQILNSGYLDVEYRILFETSNENLCYKKEKESWTAAQWLIYKQKNLKRGQKSAATRKAKKSSE